LKERRSPAPLRKDAQLSRFRGKQQLDIAEKEQQNIALYPASVDPTQGYRGVSGERFWVGVTYVLPFS
jgi:hypothetical protein